MKPELETCCQLVIEAGLSTGHAESHVELMEEVLAQCINAGPNVKALTARKHELEATLDDAREGATLAISNLIKRTETFECSGCGEDDVELGRMCVRDFCPKEHVDFTRQVWVRAVDSSHCM